MKYNVSLNGKTYEVEVEQGQAQVISVSDTIVAAPVAAPVAAAPVATAAPAAVTAPAVTGAGDPIQAPMPGTILRVNVTQGQSVKAGEILVVLEAMKMENEIVAPRDGVVSQVVTSKGAQVDSGATLLVLG